MLQHEAPPASASTRSRSRFSKALPAPPPALDTTRLEPLPSSHASAKELPSIPSLPPLSPLPLPSPSPSPSSLAAPASLARKPVRKPVTTNQTTTSSLRSISSSLPAVRPNLPSQPQPQSPLPPPPPPMSIPRRPVLPPKQNPPPQPEPQPPPQHPPPPQVVTGKEDAPVPDDRAQASPTNSIDSLLSAYSISSDADSFIRSYGESRSQRDSGATDSAEHEAAPDRHEGTINTTRKERMATAADPPRDDTDTDIRRNEGSTEKRQAAQHVPGSSPITTTAERIWEKRLPVPPPAAVQEEKGPRPPRKDDSEIRIDTSTSSTSASSATGPRLAGITGSSPQRPELWRRRCSEKSDSSSQLPDLQLPSSHGSTAASQPPAPAPVYRSRSSSSATVRPSKSHDPASPRRPSISSTQPGPEGSSGRAHYPHPGGQVVDQESADGDTMGSGCSKLKPETIIQSYSDVRAGDHAGDETHETQRGGVSLHGGSRPQHDHGSRLPTPNYQTTKDTQRPESAGQATITGTTIPPTPSLEALPQVVAKDERSAIPRKAVSREPSLRAAQSLPQIGRAREAVTSNETPPALDPTVRVRDFAAHSTIPQPTRSSPIQPRHLHRPPAGWDPRPGPGWRPASRAGHVSGPASRPASRVVYNELRVEDLPPPDPRALRFPRTVDAPAPPGTVFRPLPIKPHMLRCHTAHREMRASPQGSYAVACQACGMEDLGERWSCTWCHLRICGGCRRALAQNGCDLGELLAQLRDGSVAAPLPGQ